MLPSAKIDRAALAAAVAIAIRYTSRPDVIPILGCVRIRASREHTVIVSATDLDRYIEIDVPAETSPDLDVILPGKKLHDMLSKAKASKIATIDADPETETATLSLDGLAITLPTRATADLPAPIPAPSAAEKSIGFFVPTADFLKLFRRAMVAVSTEETRYYLNGVFLTPYHTETGAKLRAVCTDGHRLVLQDVPMPDIGGQEWPEPFRGSPGIIVPRLTVTDLIRHLSAKGAPAVIGFETDGHRASFSFGDMTIRTKLIDGTFPDYVRTIPKPGTARLKATFNRLELAGAIRQVLVVKGERQQPFMALRFEAGAHKAVAWAKGDEGASAEIGIATTTEWLATTNRLADGRTEDVPAPTTLELGFNGELLIDQLTGTDGGDVTIAMIAPGDPATVLDNDDPGYFGIVMPLKMDKVR